MESLIGFRCFNKTCSIHCKLLSIKHLINRPIKTPKQHTLWKCFENLGEFQLFNFNFIMIEDYKNSFEDFQDISFAINFSKGICAFSVNHNF